MRPFRETLGYFLEEGIVYGMMLGIYAGTAFMPIVGTLLGGVYGFVIGIGTALVCALVTYMMQPRVVDEETDLESDSRRLTRIVGVVGGLSSLLMLWLTSDILIRFILSVDPRVEFNVPLIGMFSLLFAIPALLLADLSAAYAASHYPEWLVRRLSRKGQIDISQDELPASRETVSVAFDTLINNSATRKIVILSGVLALVAYSGLFVQALTQGRWIRGEEVVLFLLSAPIGAIAGFIAWAYVIQGNAMLLTFLKRVIYREHLAHLSPHWYRISLTLISFVLTWAMIWWTIIFAPIIAAIVAFVVYRTIALPDETIDKAKRKEKTPSPLRSQRTNQKTKLEVKKGNGMRINRVSNKNGCFSLRRISIH